jgi:hypothetical protein
MIDTLGITAEEKKALLELADRLGMRESPEAPDQPTYPRITGDKEAFARYLIVEQRRREAEKKSA